ncbi:MAG: hypothetical protein EOP34_01730 [Rickettsiales bacterium]|nr:MAG: hypothetical protein EOP34_01730 [Rickettsiales bacterium]
MQEHINLGYLSQLPFAEGNCLEAFQFNTENLDCFHELPYSNYPEHDHFGVLHSQAMPCEIFVPSLSPATYLEGLEQHENLNSLNNLPYYSELEQDVDDFLEIDPYAYESDSEPNDETVYNDLLDRKENLAFFDELPLNIEDIENEANSLLARELPFHGHSIPEQGELPYNEG